MSARHFLSLMDYSSQELGGLIRRAIELKDLRKRSIAHEPLQGRVLGMIFEKASTRTRVSFEAGCFQLGGHALFLTPRDVQLGRGEPVEDTTRVLDRQVAAIVWRTFGQERIEEARESGRKLVSLGMPGIGPKSSGPRGACSPVSSW